VTQQWGDLTGEQFETLCVSEIHKWCSSSGRDVELSFHRTRSNLEVDLLLRTASGIMGVDMKNRERVDHTDTRGLRAIAPELGAQRLGGLVLYRGSRLAGIIHEDVAKVGSIALQARNRRGGARRAGCEARRVPAARRAVGGSDTMESIGEEEQRSRRPAAARRRPAAS
jgi:hypothetical protein